MNKCCGDPLVSGRVYLKKLKLSRLAANNDENRACPTSQYRTIRRVLARSKDKSKAQVCSPYLQQAYAPVKKHNKSAQCRVKTRKHAAEDTQEQDADAIRVQVHFKGQRYSLYVHSHQSGQIVEAVKRELLARARQSNQHVGEFLRIVGFETVSSEKQLDYILSLDSIELGLRSLSLRPLLHCRKGERISLGDFALVKCLGSGGFSQVFLVRSRFDNRYYAMKLMNKKFILDNERESIVENERFIMEAARHPFLVQLFYAFETENFFAFVLQYCAGGQLFFRLKQVKRMTEEQARFYFVEILLGLQYLHQHQIVYRDIKPENLLIGQDGHTRIADFGLAKPNIDSKTVSYSFCGSPEYMAPEMLTRVGHGFALDYYCVGALLYQLVTGLPPFYSKNHEQIYHSILNEELQFPAHVDLSTEIRSLLRSLLDKNPKLRLGSYRGVAEILIHPWIGKLDRAEVLAKKLKPPYVPDPYTFNFDSNELEGDIRQVYKKVAWQQSNPQPFEPYFSDKFTFETKRDPKQEQLLLQYRNYREKTKLQCKSVRHGSLQKNRSMERLQLHRTPLRDNRDFDRRLYHVASHREL